MSYAVQPTPRTHLHDAIHGVRPALHGDGREDGHGRLPDVVEANGAVTGVVVHPAVLTNDEKQTAW